MKPYLVSTLLALTISTPGVVFAGESAKPTQTQSKSSAVSLSDLMSAPKQYANQTLTVTGRYAGMCADGADFYFKDKLSTIEVLLPPSGIPKDMKVGAPLRVTGQVLVRGGEGEEGEVLIKPTAVELDAAVEKAK